MLIVTDKFLQYGSSRGNNHGVPGVRGSAKRICSENPQSSRGADASLSRPSHNAPFHDCAPAYQNPTAP